MRRIQSQSINSFIVLMFFCVNAALSQEYSARYRVTFVSEWTASTHPQDYPNSAHFSPLIGNTHNAGGFIWQPGELATPGIEQMAESGGTFSLTQEINGLITSGNAESRLDGPGAGPLNSVSLEFDVTESHSLVSLVTMIAPSPDWFIGVHGLDLLDAEGFWIQETMIDLLPYDSGTDDGMTFIDNDANTNPPEPITRITTAPLSNNVPFGVFFFQRLSTSGISPDTIFSSDFDQ